MTKKKKIIIAVVIALILIIAYFTFFYKGKDGTTLLGGTLNKDPRPCTDAENYNRDWLKNPLPIEDDIHVVGETTECQRKYMTSVCGTENWKCRKMIKAGAYIPTDWKKNAWNGCNVSDGRILEWVYELYYLSGKSWADQSQDRVELLNQAEYQACRVEGKVS
jgi:hypothetical protein